jgi:hypothetical protein
MRSVHSLQYRLPFLMNAYGAGANDQENAKIERDYAIREATRIRRKGEKQLGDMYIAVAKSGFRPTGSLPVHHKPKQTGYLVLMRSVHSLQCRLPFYKSHPLPNLLV